jgi:molybdate transport system substrate-binding protein
VTVRRAIATAAIAPLVLCSCAHPAPEGAGRRTTVTVFAAASLDRVFTEMGRRFARNQRGLVVRFSFAGTDSVVAQIEQGAPADVFAGASTSYGDRLAREGLIESPEAMCTNRVVLVVPASNPARIASPRDLMNAGTKLVVGSETVPIGVYTRRALSRLDSLYGRAYSKAVLSRVVSYEHDVETVLAKVRTGDADAGFVYASDAVAAGADVRIVPLPRRALVVATYPIAVVRSTSQREAAGRFVQYVLSPAGKAALRKAGFGPRPLEPA